ncbi:hypothetical protein ES319_D12G038100v1 [Gossypium barbadense]|uniref:Reverse transcriptase zinc-binding domain-containing protein n=3 Tax=Gossypium TaxID=3633 RepID=A0A5J5NWE9_GOSBA|nr:hypothetical protein ES319_D12G038100v1 [Gossypium barbadense]TYG39745.1 hypothetical protein ES288_D12G039800v1 [Gossypium darwinii]
MHWCKWSDLCKPKDLGGLGFRDLCKFNVALLAKQGWRFLIKPESLVARIFKAKYFPHRDFWNARIGNYPSYVWKSTFAARKLLEEGMGWKVGSGTKINVWRDNWLPRRAGGRIHKTTANNSISMVSELIDQAQQRWKEDVITSIFDAEEAAAILCIPLPRSVEEDKVVWMGDCTGEYSVRGGYRVLINSGNTNENSLHNTEVYRKLWLLDIPAKSKTTIWRMMYNFIPTPHILYNRRIAFVPTCPRYGCCPESI